jgi:hypothetical protein
MACLPASVRRSLRVALFASVMEMQPLPGLDSALQAVNQPNLASLCWTDSGQDAQSLNHCTSCDSADQSGVLGR